MNNLRKTKQQKNRPAHEGNLNMEREAFIKAEEKKKHADNKYKKPYHARSGTKRPNKSQKP